MKGVWYKVQEHVFSCGKDAFYIAKEKRKGYEYRAFESVKDYITLHNKMSTNNPKALVYNEVIAPWNKRRVHVDVDWEPTKKSPFCVATFLELLLDALSGEIQHKTGEELRGEDVWLLDSSGVKEGKQKISLHVILSRHHSESAAQLKYFMTNVQARLVRSLTEHTYNMQHAIDMGVYAESRLFRIYGNTKYGEQRYLRLAAFNWRGVTYQHEQHEQQDSETILLNTLVTCCDDNSIVLHYDGVISKEAEPYTADLLRHQYDEAIAVTRVALAASEWVYEPDDTTGRSIRLKRCSRGWCRLCKRSHDTENAMIYVSNDGAVLLRCWRDKEKSALLGYIRLDTQVDPKREKLPEATGITRRTQQSSYNSLAVINYLVSTYGIIVGE